MATAIQFRRGTTAQHANFTGLIGEITVDTDLKTIRVHDGSTAAGTRLATFAEIQALGEGDITGVAAGNGLIGGGEFGSVTLNVGAGAGITVNADNVAVNTAYYDVTNGGTGWAGNLEPSANNTFSLGSPTRVWNDVYVGPNSLIIDGVALGISNGVLQFGGANVAVAGSASSNADTRGLFSVTDTGGDGSLSYNNTTGVITYTGPDQTEANTRIDARLSGGTGITYTSGVIATTITQYTDTLARAAISVTDTGGDGSLSYNNTTGVITYTGPDQSEANARIDARLSGGTGVTYANGLISIGQAVGTTSEVSFAKITTTSDVVVGGNLTVQGTQVILNTTTVETEDTIFRVNSGGATGANVGFEANVGGNIKQIVYTTANKWSIGAETLVAGVFEGNLTGNVTGTVSSIANHSTTNLAEGTNLYFTAARARGNISVTDSGGDGSLNYDNSTGVITYTGPSQAEANTRIDARLSGGNGLTYTSGVFAVGAGYGISVAADTVAVSNSDVRALFSASGDISYNVSTGVFSFTNDAGDIESVTAGSGLTGGGTSGAVTLNIGAGTGIIVNADDVAVNATYIKGLFSATDSGGDGSFSYSDGVFTYTGPSQAEANTRIDARLSGGTGITYTSGVIAAANIPNSSLTNSSITINGTSVALGGTRTLSTTDIAEGTNLYFTAARARGNISVTDAGGDGSLSYDSGTGVITYTGPSATEVRAHLAGGAGLTYSSGTFAVGAGTGITVNADDVAVNASYVKGLFSATDAGGDGSFSYSDGVFTYTGPSQAEANTRIDARLSGGTGITYTSGVIAAANIPNSSLTNSSITINGTSVALGGTRTLSTTDVAEGTNLYFTAARARGNISVTDAGGDGSLSYNNTTGVITYTGPSQSEANTRIDARLSGGTGVTYTSGVIAIGQAVGTGNNVTFNDLTVNGNLTISGTTTTVNTETINLADNIILLNSNEAGTPSQDAGIEIERGTSTNKTLVWDETADKWTVGAETFVAATFEGAVTGNVTGTVSSIANHTTTNLAEGTNLYFTAARSRGNVSATTASGISYDSGTGVFSLSSIPNSSLTNSSITINGTAVALGGTRTLSTTDVAEGTNQYFTTARANTAIDARIVGGNGLTYTSGNLNVGAGAGITVNADNVALTSGIVTAAAQSGGISAITVDTFGRVTSVTANAGFTTNTGTVTSVGGTGTVNGLTLTGTVTTSGSLTLGGTLAVAASDFASQTAKTFLAAPNAANGVPTFRTIVASDVPTLNQNTTGSAATLTTARTIGGVSFNGSANIDLPGVNTAGNQNTSGTAAGLSATLVATSGGTGQSSYAVGDLLFASTTTALSKLADVATGNALISGGVGVAPSYGKIGLTTHVSGTLPVANGGTGITSLGAGVATFLGTPSSANLLAAVTDETGTGALVFATSPTLVTPTLGVATATSINKVAITAPATGSTLTIADGKTLTASNTLTFTGTDASSVAFGAGGTVAYTANKLSAFAATTSAELAGVISDETGSGALVFATSPTLVTPALGTPSSGTLTSCTGLPISTGVSGLGSGVATFLATPSSANLLAAVTNETGTGALVFATSPTLVTPVLGTPSSGTLTSCTGLPIVAGTTGTLSVARGGTGITSFGAGIATFLGTPSSANLLAAVTDETGTGALVFANTPTLVTPNIGAATGTSLTLSGAVSVGTNLTVTGNLIINGTTTTVNSTTVTIDDPIFTIGGDTAPASDDNKDRGIEFRWHNGTSAKIGFFGFDDSTGHFTFIPDAINTSEVFSGTTGTLDVASITGSAAKWTTARTITLGGDLSGSVSLDGSENVTLTATVAADSVALGTDTTGDYVASMTAGSGITVGTATGEGSTPLITNTGVLSVNGSTGAVTGVATTAGNLSQFAATTSSQLAGVISDETGSGALVFATSPTLVTPVLGTPQSGTLTNCTFPTLNQNTTGSAATLTTARTIGGVSFNGSANINLPGVNTAGNQNTTGTAAGLSATLVATSGGTGQSSYAVGDLLFASTSTALSKLADVATGSALISGGVGVAPSYGKIGLTTHVSGTLPVANGGTGITSLGAGVATFLGTPSSANLLAAVTNETGTGALVFATSPTLVTPALGTPSSGTLTSCTGLPIVAGTTGTLSVARGGTGVTTSTGTGAVVLGTSPTFTTQISVPSIVKTGTTATGNIGQSDNTFNTVFAKATSAQYADLAERYEADTILDPGTVVCFGGDKEITVCGHENHHAVAGVISTDPAYMMNSGAGNDSTHPYVALTGRVPCKVVGPVNPGDLMVASAVSGHAMANNNARAGTIIGKAIGKNQDGPGVIEVLITLM